MNAKSSPQPIPTPEEAYRDAPIGLCNVDGEGRIALANECFAEMCGTTIDAIIDRPLMSVLPEADALLAVDAVSTACADFPIRRGDITRIVRASIARGQSGLGLVLVDVTADAEHLASLTTQAERSAFALESAGQWVWDFDMIGDRVWRSQQWKRTLGFSPDEMPDADQPWSIVHPSDRKSVDGAMRRVISGEDASFEATYRLRHKDGSWRWILSRGKVIAQTADGRPARMLATSTDITRQKEIEQELEAVIRQRRLLEHDLVLANRRLKMLAEIDSLTELPNRRKFDRVLDREFRRMRRARPILALLMIDIDHFKRYNDFYGHPAGDECLRLVAEALQHVARQNRDVVTRYGGEEFAAILIDTNPSDAARMAAALQAAIHELSIPHEGSPGGKVTISIGYTLLAPQKRAPWCTPQRLIEAADRALYAAKEAGRDHICFARIEADGTIQTTMTEHQLDAPAC